MIFLLEIEKCYEAKILRHSAPLEIYFSMQSFLTEVKISISDQKPWTIVSCFDRI